MLVLLHGDEHHEGGILTEAIMVKGHAAFMVLGWLILINMGSVFGRYLKAPPNQGNFSNVIKLRYSNKNIQHTLHNLK